MGFTEQFNMCVVVAWEKELTDCEPSYYMAGQHMKYPSLESFRPLGAS